MCPGTPVYSISWKNGATSRPREELELPDELPVRRRHTGKISRPLRLPRGRGRVTVKHAAIVKTGFAYLTRTVVHSRAFGRSARQSGGVSDLRMPAQQVSYPLDVQAIPHPCSTPDTDGDTVWQRRRAAGRRARNRSGYGGFFPARAPQGNGQRRLKALPRRAGSIREKEGGMLRGYRIGTISRRG